VIDPSIPYITIPEIPILPGFGSFNAITIKPFGMLVATGVYSGWLLAVRQAKRLGFDIEQFNSFVTWVVTCGFIGGHVFDVILYHPQKLFGAASFLDGLFELLALWRSLSSFGGFMGAVVGAFLWKARYGIKNALLYCDTLGSAFPLGWLFGRTGCSVAHDHPGRRSDAWYAVQYPDGGRFDLGLYEMILTLPLVAAFLFFMKKPRAEGFYLALMCIYYAPMRFLLDFFRATDVREADPRHLGLTPAQWLCSGLLVIGIVMLVWAQRTAAHGEILPYVEEDSKGGPPPPASSDAPA